MLRGGLLLELRSAHFLAMFFSLSVPSFSVVEDHPGYDPTNYQASYSQKSSCPGWHRIVGAICRERGARCNCGGYGSCRDVRATVYSCKNEGMFLKKIGRESINWISYLGYCSLQNSGFHWLFTHLCGTVNLTAVICEIIVVLFIPHRLQLKTTIQEKCC